MALKEYLHIKNINKDYDNETNTKVCIFLTKESETFKIRSRQILNNSKVDIEYKLQ